MLIQLHQIERVYRQRTVDVFALQDVTLTISEGELTAIMGPSGSGKSTLLHILGCLDRPSQGSYHLDGIAVAHLTDPQLSSIRNQKIGFIFQSFNLLPQYTVLENIEAPLLYSRTDSRSIENSGSLFVSMAHRRKEKPQEIAERVGLGHRLHHRPSELSGGEMQRVAIARALVTNPRVILADEPTGNLDSHTGQDILQMLYALHEQGHTIIIVTHEPAVAEYAERIIFLKDGKIERDEIREARSQKSEVRRQKLEATKQKPEGTEQAKVSDTQKVPGSQQKMTTRKRSWSIATSFLSSAFCLLPSVIRGVLLHKLRSLLSVFGIVFGIGAIIAMLSIGAGAKQELVEQIALLGTTNIMVKAVTSAEDQIKTGKEQLSQGLTNTDVERIAHVSHYIIALAAVRTFSSPVQDQQQIVQARIVGTTPDYQHTGNLRLQQGRFLTATDEADMQRVCILGADIRQELFAFQNPVGKMMKIRNDWFRVIGTLENKVTNPKTISSIQVENMNKDVYIPLSTSVLFASPKETDNIQEIAIRVDKVEHVNEVAKLIRAVLTRVHHGVEDYEALVPLELMKQSQHTQNVFNLVMGCIAGISLLVGGIGIMNIMLATVTERTKEIGIRRAIGASRRMILWQFLIETVLLTFVGGCLGIMLGIGGAYLISLFAQWRTIISIQTIVLAFSISALIGIVFGLYPASQGANMDPIAALRYE
jgi:macrolide transport system ATP-binding/permease protein